MKVLAFLLLSSVAAFAARAPLEMTAQWRDYFAAEVQAIQNSNDLREIKTLATWKAQREERRRQLFEMLGLWPMPERTPLNPVITGTLEHEDLTVEKLHFQAAPRLYVTANLYLPKEHSGKIPAVLYVCGHNSGVFNGVVCGNKAGYQRHGGWFARNGYACLIIDTIQYGEVRGAHRGTYSEGDWWWNSVGYTPAGLEAWFAIRALDYLCSRPEVDVERIGMTGRSGGGAYSWTVAALDDRVKVAAPIAGMTDMRNQVIDAAVDRHCDCMFHLNTYRWDFPLIGALIAPRPLLLGNSDKDAIFPLDGVVRVHEQVRHIYRLYKEDAKFGLLITEGDHQDTQDLQVPVFRWFNRFLKNESPLVEMAAVPLFAPEQLRVFETPPADALNATAPEWFARPPARFASGSSDASGLQAALRKSAFAGWPSDKPAARLVHVRTSPAGDGFELQAYDVPIQRGIQQRLYLLASTGANSKPGDLALYVPDDSAGSSNLLRVLRQGEDSIAAAELRRLLPDAGAIAVFIPRGVGDELFARAENNTRMRRRFMLVGQTLDAMRVWDIRAAIAALRQLPVARDARLALHASGQMAVNAAFASLYDPVDALRLSSVPQDFRGRPDYFHVMRVLEHVPGVPVQSP